MRVWTDLGYAFLDARRISRELKLYAATHPDPGATDTGFRWPIRSATPYTVDLTNGEDLCDCAEQDEDDIEYDGNGTICLKCDRYVN